MVDNLLSKIKLTEELVIKQTIIKESEESKEQMAIRLLRLNLDKHGLTDWNIRISRAVRRLGSCNYPKKTISLSYFFISVGTQTSIINTILHEIAHALCPGDGHGTKWRMKAIEIGCDGKRCADGIKLDLKYNFECEKGCRASYARRCKMVDFLLTGTAKCKRHSISIISTENCD